jgi:hypothetical protein
MITGWRVHHLPVLGAASLRFIISERAKGVYLGSRALPPITWSTLIPAMSRSFKLAKPYR